MFKCWLEDNNTPKVIDTSNITEDDYRVFGSAAIVGNGHIMGYHITDNPQKVLDAIKSPKKITATYGKHSKSSELGPGIYISAVPKYWIGRATNKYSFLDNLTSDQRLKLASAIKNDKVLTGEKIGDRTFHHVTSFEREYANRYIDEWLKTNNNGVLVLLAGQPYNIAFWQERFLRPLGIQSSTLPSVIKMVLTGKFVDCGGHSGDWPFIAQMIRANYDGGFTAAALSANPELCIWKKECIKNYEIEGGKKHFD